jgi:MFS family permease
VLLKPLSEEFAWSREAVSSAFASMTLAAALTAPLMGSLFDRLGPQRISGPCLLVSGCAFASLALLTPRLWHLYVVFTAVGLVTTGTSAVVYSRAVASWFDRRRGTALAVVISSGALGAILHPPAAETLIRLAGWRTACLVLGVTVLAIGVPTVIRFVRERGRTTSRDSHDAPGMPLRDAVRSRIFWALIVVVFGSTLAMNGALVHLSALLTDRGIAAERAAIVLSAMGAASLAGRLLTGWLIDRFLATHVSFTLLAIASAGTFLLAGANSFTAAVLAVSLIGFGTGGEFDITPYLLSRYFGLRALSTLYGLNWTAWGVAGAIGPILMARGFDTSGSYDSVLVIFATGTFAVGALMLALPAYERPQAATVVVG